MDLYKAYSYQFNMSEKVPFVSLVNLRQLVFEVTSNCNLECEYCGYGELYNTRRMTHGSNLKFSIAKNMIDYLFDLWNNNESSFDHRQTLIGFYGGEPLLNMSFIKKTIEYIESLPLPKRRSFAYTMTTNGMLLEKHMDYLAEKKFTLLISIDGDEHAHSYRVDHKGVNSFNQVFANIKLFQQKYPEYFSKNVSFNAVLTDRGKIFDIKDFIYKNFGKYPAVSEMNESGVLSNRKSKFDKIFQPITNNWEDPKNKEIKEKFYKISPLNKKLYDILMRLSGNSFQSYHSLLATQDGAIFPTGTCFPFDRKAFVTVSGDLLPCERINQKFSIGKVTEKKVCINFKEIAEKYSQYYKKIWVLCKTCYGKPICGQCLFHVDNIENKPSCNNYLNKKQYDEFIRSSMNYLGKNPDLYEKMMKDFF